MAYALDRKPLSRFDHHPDSEIDLEVEVEIIEAMTHECLLGLQAQGEVVARVARVMRLKFFPDSPSWVAQQRAFQCAQAITEAWA